MTLPPHNDQHDTELDEDQARRPKEGPTRTHVEKEPAGHEGTLGGQPPLNAPAGIQRIGRGGVLVEKSPNAADDEAPPAGAA
ncbi:hypothetical protein HBDW_14470 [Herbaspirillum sp. DW155]|uniref:hypothetical protein n=1 Tax=Herbaspirillum sp. DW155 TaxID=3095609 RepID=UPI00308882F3|nr:hypothetical protein HBDW_14470 [Herbaspirillum sp. DW155]